ncbi:YbhB/YbcL family Raf kinase inhibitor-like protein [Luteimonas sp. SJ-16]|uniref:YbhB/YbcL family Raf kinase inhibitor-like protein n=1 Tax=Luteimonas deserti TaxID=2752306 RepID=A0A7Z0QSZ4_9GAMM|nr:YbhB/YbcL family Raf kinase inhibitor-like protein [Luteimonas deserti]
MTARPAPRLLSLAVSALLVAAGPVLAQQGDGTDTASRNTVFKPAPAEPTPERLAELTMPDGFEIGVFASGLQNPRILAMHPDGHVYVSRREQGDVLLLHDTDGDGRADGAPVPVLHRPAAHGLAVHGDHLYVVTVKELLRAPIQADGRLGEPELLVDDLPDGGQHPNRTMAFGPDGKLYLSIGSTCNACNETNPEHATLLRMEPDGSSRTIFASGLRNTVGFGWQPTTGELWGMDHNIDSLGDDQHPEELNRIELGKQYGWPHVFADGGLHPQTTPPGGISKAQWREMSEPMVMGYTAHAAPMQMAFYQGASFPAEYRGDAFVAMRGSWNAKPAVGYEIVRVRFDRGRPTGIEPFVSGFLVDDGTAHLARPVGLAVLPDGALLLSDDGNGVIYRIAYSGGSRSPRAASRTPAVPAGPMEQQALKGHGVPLALDRRETRARSSTPGSLQSAAFADGQPIPERYSDYGEGVSPPLSWQAVEGARSYALIMEDPDADQPKPFVHWVAWNIPGTITSLPEAMHTHPRLTEPDGLRQGRNSRGSTGYFGPKPPPGTGVHHYHFQLFALDTTLDVLPGADRDSVLKAMQGHVIGRARVVGTFAAPGED